MREVVGRVLANLYPSPSWFPQAFDSTWQWVRMVRFAEQDYRTAAFLDQRGLNRDMEVAVVPFARLVDRTPTDARRDAHWIFHTSHVGSTLVSMLLGDIPGVLALREPVLLRALPAMGEAERTNRLPVVRALLARTFAKEQRALVKATSYLSEQAATLVGPQSDGGKALMIRMRPERFIAARLGTKLVELRARTPERLARLSLRAPGIDPAQATQDDAHLAATAWAAETSALEEAAAAIGPQRVQFLDFDRFLGAPLEQLQQLATHFEWESDAGLLERIVEGPLMARYSKNSAAQFDPAARDASIERQLADNAPAIAAAMRWLDGLAKDSPLVSQALERPAA